MANKNEIEMYLLFCGWKIVDHWTMPNGKEHYCFEPPDFGEKYTSGWYDINEAIAYQRKLDNNADQ